jgi:hypothetical protein
MSNRKLPERIIRYSLASLLLLVALNAFGGGYYGLSGAKDIPAEWLKDSPFRNYFIPGLILFICVGGSAFVAAVAVFKNHRLARSTAFISGVVVLVWITVQMIIIGYVSWLQPASAIAGLLIIFLTSLLPEHEH